MKPKVAMCLGFFAFAHLALLLLTLTDGKQETRHFVLVMTPEGKIIVREADSRETPGFLKEEKCDVPDRKSEPEPEPELPSGGMQTIPGLPPPFLPLPPPSGKTLAQP